MSPSSGLKRRCWEVESFYGVKDRAGWGEMGKSESSNEEEMVPANTESASRVTSLGGGGNERAVPLDVPIITNEDTVEN
jgi:hypothetical protein